MAIFFSHSQRRYVSGGTKRQFVMIAALDDKLQDVVDFIKVKTNWFKDYPPDLTAPSRIRKFGRPSTYGQKWVYEFQDLPR